MRKGKGKTNVKDVQGSRANKAGKRLENMVAAEFAKHGIYSKSYKDWVSGINKEPNGVLVKNVPYTNIYGYMGRTEFVLVRDGFGDVRIECRFQQVAGSVDEKLPYTFGNAVVCKESTVVLVVEGNGFRKGAKDWLANQAAAVKHKNIYVMSFVGFQNWVDTILGTKKTKEVKRVYHGRKATGTTYHGKARRARS